MKIEIGVDELDAIPEIYCRDCRQLITGKMWLPYIVVGEQTDNKYKWAYARCTECYIKWEEKNDKK